VLARLSFAPAIPGTADSTSLPRRAPGGAVARSSPVVFSCQQVAVPLQSPPRPRRPS
jgi:hypothetical protein